MNKCFFFGTVVREPVFRKVGEAQTPLVNFTLLVSRTYKTRDGQPKVEKQYLDYEAWDSGAENIRDNAHDGTEMFVECCAKKESWQDKDTQAKHSRVKFRVENFHIVSSNSPAPEEPQAIASGGADGEIPF
jgi:single-stranded DNA-binding protein